MFALLERYLRALDLSAVTRVVFCGDGAAWIWTDVEALIERLGLEAACTHQVLDYTHAKQNLHQILAWLPKRLRTPKVERQWKALLWRGDIAGLGQAIEQTFLSKRGQKKALAKWQSYFAGNAHRMQYEGFQRQGLPCGSGSVESAIRRVINLRLKAPGTFWTPAMAECFLFLRAQLVSGRWEVMLANIAAETAKQVCPDSLSEPLPARTITGWKRLEEERTQASHGGNAPCGGCSSSVRVVSMWARCSSVSLKKECRKGFGSNGMGFSP